MYTEAEAARLLRLSQGTLHYWLEGGERRGRQYLPIIREEARGSRSVTWAEFVEAGLLREYRQTHGVPMFELRKFIDELRSTLGVPYPLAHQRPYVSGRNLIFQAQITAGLDPEYCLVAVANDQLVLTGPSESFMQKVLWADDIAVGWRPATDPDSTVTIDPDTRFGRPSVGGISTEALWEQATGGETYADLAETYGLPLRDVTWAVVYETALRVA